MEAPFSRALDYTMGACELLPRDFILQVASGRNRLLVSTP
jgi:hypothetical protein